MKTGTKENPVHRLESDHLIGLRDTTVYYEKIGYNLNLFWATDYCKEHNVKLRKVVKK